MRCVHPECPLGEGKRGWNEVLELPEVAAKLKAEETEKYLSGLAPLGSSKSRKFAPPPSKALLDRVLAVAPCLYAQLDVCASAAGIVHLCEASIGKRITDSSVIDAFKVQHPTRHSKHQFLHPPVRRKKNAGPIMEELCSEVLSNAGVPRMGIDDSGWPIWEAGRHASLNDGKLRSTKAFGDILIPCAPSNIVVSIKAESARERLLYSANMIEGVGYGFFTQPEEFVSESRVSLFKRMGFSAIYLPANTFDEIMKRVSSTQNTNFNGTALYRPMDNFSRDMKRVINRTSLEL